MDESLEDAIAGSSEFFFHRSLPWMNSMKDATSICRYLCFFAESVETTIND
jgi:hypothetical protein